MAINRKPRKPKLKKMPKKPKASSSLEVHKRYEDRAATVEKENKKRMADYQKELAAYDKVKKEKEKIRSKF